MSLVWFNGYPNASAGAQFPDAEWLSLDCVQTGHWNTPGGADVDPTKEQALLHWRGSSPYEAIRKMYNNPRSDGTPRPVIDLEAHYEATHHAFTYDLPLWTADDIRTGAWQSVSIEPNIYPTLADVDRCLREHAGIHTAATPFGRCTMENPRPTHQSSCP